MHLRLSIRLASLTTLLCVSGALWADENPSLTVKLGDCEEIATAAKEQCFKQELTTKNPDYRNFIVQNYRLIDDMYAHPHGSSCEQIKGSIKLACDEVCTGVDCLWVLLPKAPTNHEVAAADAPLPAPQENTNNGFAPAAPAPERNRTADNTRLSLLPPLQPNTQIRFNERLPSTDVGTRVNTTGLTNMNTNLNVVSDKTGGGNYAVPPVYLLGTPRKKMR